MKNKAKKRQQKSWSVLKFKKSAPLRKLVLKSWTGNRKNDLRKTMNNERKATKILMNEES